MTHLDLFSGIGGFAYAIDQVWDNVEHIFCDNDKFCRQVLKKHWPESDIFDDIRQIDTDTLNTGLESGNGQEQAPGQRDQLNTPRQDQRPRPFILTGGFPCQPYSAAGLRRGTADARHLWPEMLRVIRLTAPKWVIAENVGGLLTWNDGLVFEQVCTDLESAGYDVQAFVIPAVAVNAPHRRDRVWFVGHAKHDGQHGTENGKGDIKRTDGNTARQDELRQPQGTDSLRPDATDSRRQQRPSGNQGKPERAYHQLGRFDWTRDWHEVAAELCSVDDGLPVALDGFKLSKSQHRKEQLKAYGNAIVPQVAIEIMEAIRLSQRNRHEPKHLTGVLKNANREEGDT